MWTEQPKLKTDGFSLVRRDTDVPARRTDSLFSDTVIRLRVVKESRSFERVRMVLRINRDIFLPTQCPATREKEMIPVLREMVYRELFIRLCEAFGSELTDVRHSATLNVSGTPTGVDELPFAVFDTDCVPGVTCFVGRNRRIRC